MGADGRIRLFVPCLAATTCDWPEQCDLSGTKMGGSAVRFDVKTADMDKSDADLGPLVPRTEKGIMQVRAGRGAGAGAGSGWPGPGRRPGAWAANGAAAAHLVIGPFRSPPLL